MADTRLLLPSQGYHLFLRNMAASLHEYPRGEYIVEINARARDYGIYTLSTRTKIFSVSNLRGNVVIIRRDILPLDAG